MIDKELLETDEVSRFIRQNSHMKGGRVRHPAFMPPPPQPGMSPELSLLRTQEMTDEEIWDISKGMGTPIVGRAINVAGDYYSQGLGIRSTPNHLSDQHVDALPLPEEKDKQLYIAKKLSQLAALQVKPDPSAEQA